MNDPVGTKLERFGSLVDRVQACRKCPRMSGSARVLGFGCGPIGAPVMVVGEAPGRLGADESLMPFHGDRAGHNFESLIEQVGLTRYDLFVTNAVLCNPKGENGNNATPTSTEVSNCSSFLREQIDILQPKVVVTLGATALKASSLVDAHSFSLGESVRTLNNWYGRKLIPLYHPGQRAMLHRSYANQLADYQFVAETIRRATRRTKARPSVTRAGSRKIASVARKILEQNPDGISYFALHKLYFLSEVAHVEAVGERLSNAYVVRQKDGPYCVDLQISKLSRMIPGLVVRTLRGELRISLPLQRTFEETEYAADLSHIERDIIDQTVSVHRGKTNAQLKRVAYLSPPMREVLRSEKGTGANLFNVALLPQPRVDVG